VAQDGILRRVGYPHQALVAVVLSGSRSCHKATHSQVAVLPSPLDYSVLDPAHGKKVIILRLSEEEYGLPKASYHTYGARNILRTRPPR
jgi:hypothetical protein